MSSISALSNWRPVAPPPAVGRTAATGSPASPRATPSALVRLSAEGVAASRQDQAAEAGAPVSTAARFKGLGYAMLTQFTAGAPIAADHAPLPATLDNQFTLSVTTRSGVKVDLTLASVDDDMVLQVSADAALGQEERKALSDLAAGFQDAIDGLAGDSPQVRLGALTRFDSVHLQSLSLHAEVRQGTLPPSTQTLDFQLDGTQRKVRIDGAAGSAEVSIDTGKLESLGSKQQQSKAIANYLAQFDQATARGHGDLQLMSLFKDAFSDLSRTAVTEQQQRAGLASQNKWTLATADQAALTGLADFSATVTQAPKWSNPARPREVDNFSYEVSQHTRIDGPRRDDRTVSQVQQSKLNARFHEALKKGGEVQLDLTPQSQNYEYHQIADQATSDVELGYQDGHLKLATLLQTASQSEQVQKYILGKLVSDRTIPQQQTLVRNLADSLADSLAAYRSGDSSRAGGDSQEARDRSRALSLSALNDRIFLTGSPGELARRA